MENYLLYRLVDEVRLQCRWAQFAFHNLRASIQGMDTEKIFFYTNAFLNHALILARWFWPERPESQARGERLRQELELADDSPVALRGFRSQWEQVDERIEDWLGALEHKNSLPMNVMPRGTMANFQADDFQRSLDPETLKIHVRGDLCDLRLVAQTLVKLEATCERWRKTHNPW